MAKRLSRKEKNTKTSSAPRVVKTKQWNGVQWTYDFKINNSNKFSRYLLGNSTLSIFYGSQRGGLICANGVCAIQPEFIDGIKLSFSRTF